MAATIEQLTVNPQTLTVVDSEGAKYEGSLVGKCHFDRYTSQVTQAIVKEAQALGADAFLILDVNAWNGYRETGDTTDGIPNRVADPVLDLQLAFYRR